MCYCSNQANQIFNQLCSSNIQFSVSYVNINTPAKISFVYQKKNQEIYTYIDYQTNCQCIETLITKIGKVTGSCSGCCGAKNPIMKAKGFCPVDANSIDLSGLYALPGEPEYDDSSNSTSNDT